MGGAFDAGNLAREAGAAAFAIDQLDFGVHFIVNLNDGIYGNTNSWIGLTGSPGIAGISLGGLKTVASLAFGRDNGGEEQTFMDRTAGRYVLQYTQVASPSAATPDSDWTAIGELNYNCVFPDSTPWLRHRYNFPPIEATGVRLLVPATGLPAGTAIDEIEIYAASGAVTATPPPTLLAPLATGGPLTTPALAGDVPALADGNLARGADAIAFGTPPFPAPAHTIPHLNDGLYGNSNSWLGIEPGAASGKVYAGIYFNDGLKDLAQIAFGRDNLGAFGDRIDGIYTIQYTQDAFDPSNDAAVDAAAWTAIGFAALCTTPSPLRRLYSFSQVSARAVRILTVLGNVIDELELGMQIGAPPPPVLPLVETGGPVTTPALPTDVPSLALRNVARAPDAVAFGTPPFPHPAHTIPHLNDGFYGNSNSWLGNEPGPASGKVYAGIYFTDGVRRIRNLALGRDNTGTFGDRAVGTYLVQFTLDEFDPASDAATDAANWRTVGEATAHLSDGLAAFRHVYCLGGIQARAVRVLTALGNVIDELELLDPVVGEIVLSEVGGTFDAKNLSTAGALAFAIDALADIGFDNHRIEHLNDGLYGNTNSWIGNTGNPGIAGIAFGGPGTVVSIAFGRDNGGEAQTFTDRATGLYILQYTTASAPGATTPDCDWITIGQIDVNSFCPPSSFLRHRYNFPAVEATGIRLIVPATGLAAGTAIDELEAYNYPGAGSLECVVPVPLELVQTGGPLATPAAAGDVPTFEDGNAARAPDAVAFGTPPFPHPAHTIPHLNDGLYGNSNSWLGNEPGPTSQKVYAGVYFSGGPRQIHGIALGRDNLSQFLDRAAGPYLVQYTLDTFDPAADGATDAANWIPVGLAQAHLTDGMAHLRHRYRFDLLSARAIRVLTEGQNAIDEIELFEPRYQLAGDCNQDGRRDVTDIVCILRLKFRGFFILDRSGVDSPCGGDDLTSPGNLMVLDLDGNNQVDIPEILFLARHLFTGGPPPVQGAGCLLVPEIARCGGNVGCP
ncbi:MAG: hypothetical protein HY717_09865 [Planctomycetes bacterium]|nr:hypothetical protein [Planctomycetota bacterium]